jgi:hypothetical protein
LAAVRGGISEHLTSLGAAHRLALEGGSSCQEVLVRFYSTHLARGVSSLALVAFWSVAACAVAPTVDSAATPSAGAAGAAPVIAPELGAPPLTAATESAALVPSIAAGDVTAPLSRVDVDGVRGALVPVPFLSPQERGLSLIQVDWELPAGKEQYLCGRVTVPSELYIREFQALSPLGTHHTAVTIREAPNGPDGVTECDVSEVGPSSVFGSGVGTLGKSLPDGLGVKISAGSQIIFNLHLLNISEAPLRGRSGTLVETTTADRVQQLVDGVAVGPLKLNVPPGRSVQGGVCTVDHDYTIFAVLPHMHQTGVHLRLLAQRAGLEPLVLHDGPYDFDNQVAHNFEPLALHKGDTLAIECTFENPQPVALRFGESSNDEMCLAAVARYPAGGKATCPY